MGCFASFRCLSERGNVFFSLKHLLIAVADRIVARVSQQFIELLATMELRLASRISIARTAAESLDVPVAAEASSSNGPPAIIPAMAAETASASEDGRHFLPCEDWQL